jgi:hypothetical protein
VPPSDNKPGNNNPGNKKPATGKPKPPPRVYAEPNNPAYYATIQKYVSIAFVFLAVVTFGMCIWFIADGHTQQGTAAFLIPIALFIASRLVPRGWRGGPVK